MFAIQLCNSCALKVTYPFFPFLSHPSRESNKNTKKANPSTELSGRRQMSFDIWNIWKNFWDLRFYTKVFWEHEIEIQKKWSTTKITLKQEDTTFRAGDSVKVLFGAKSQWFTRIPCAQKKQITWHIGRGSKSRWIFPKPLRDPPNPL